MSAVSAWQWMAVLGMALGTGVFMAMGAGARPQDRYYYVISLLITLAAGGFYLLTAVGPGALGDPEGRAFYLARYADRAITTPLLLCGLALVALPRLGGRPALVGGLVAADLCMVAAGLAAGLSGPPGKYLWFAASSAAFLVVLALIWGPLRLEAHRRNSGRTGLFYNLAAILTVLWSLYPLVWLSGGEGFALTGAGTETFLWAALDLASKVGYGLVLLTGVGRTAARERMPGDRADAGEKSGVRWR